MKKLVALIMILFCILTAEAQTKFKIVQNETDTWRSIYSLVDKNNKTIKVLDSVSYFMVWSGFDYSYFSVVAKKGSKGHGWPAIDANENILFHVYNTSYGEPSPDYLIENKIRIIDENEKIGFANEMGKIIIKPQFEIVTSFHNGYAIIAEKCKKVPWGNHEHDDGCNHYSIECERHGYIDEKGKIIKLGNFTFEQIMEEIKWKPDE
ncbi:WG repeat-containing protein [Empedobacter stercoris]|uniref:WG repeat-containing protein n=1 Tax=Empedobacter stercoris TaxID=1628248 RepID=A0ABX1WPD5_9FLAO|nr:WG repeat-containing protein [Empedobacter stercoris]MCA4810308.1 WG repeat-containing protein [Empedobacter stercoris]NOJ76382.1 WG repeat-containing protein [Empedobacter stercoris]QNT14513.1 WG repeat-containing protein [Empedobacter stercoris]